jgi:integrase
MTTEKRKKTAARLHLLTARQVQNAGDGDHSDGGGLLLRVRGESASWVFRYTSPAGRRREMGFGVAFRGSAAQAGESLMAARDSAHTARDQLRVDIDPIDARDARRESERQAEEARKADRSRERWTLARCGRDYHERVIEPTKTTKHAAQWIASLENHLPPRIWHAPVDAITPPDLLQALLGIKPHERARRHDGDTVPETMRRIRQRLDAIFEDAIFHSRCAANPAAAVKRKLQEAMPRQKAGEFLALDYREAPALLAQLRKAPGTAARCLELAVLTAARTSEALDMRWHEVDLDAGVWTVPAERMKAGEEHAVFLPQRAIDILTAQKALQLSPDIVFPSPVNPEAPLSNMALLSVLERLGARDRTTVHGLCRSTFSTWANETAAGRPDVIEACLAHSERDRVRAAYNRAKFNEERRALLGAWADYLAATPAKVLPFEARAA